MQFARIVDATGGGQKCSSPVSWEGLISWSKRTASGEAVRFGYVLVAGAGSVSFGSATAMNWGTAIDRNLAAPLALIETIERTIEVFRRVLAMVHGFSLAYI